MGKSGHERETDLTKKHRTLRRLWPPIVILIALGVAYFVIPSDFQRLALFALVAVTVVYAFFTYEQAVASRKIAEEAHESRFASFQPIVVLGRSPAPIESQDKSVVMEQTAIKHRTYLYNVGPGPALNLRFFIREPNRKNPSGDFSGKELRALGPGEVYELDLMNIFGQMRWSSHDLTVEYEDIFGGKWCSGLELNYTQEQEEFTVLNLFYEKLD